MVSIRRRRLLGMCSGRSCILAPLPWGFEHRFNHENGVDNIKLCSVHPLPSNDKPKEETTWEAGPGTGSSNVSASSPSKDLLMQQFPEVKRRKRHRRKHVENQEECIMRGVYFKNLKWQAAIKVDKKQIHLGTVGSQEEAARLYDRAAFMCGREPNFELSEEEKQELTKFNWEEFLAMTRSAITNKSKPCILTYLNLVSCFINLIEFQSPESQRRTGSGPRRKLQENEWESEHGCNASSSASEDQGLAS